MISQNISAPPTDKCPAVLADIRAICRPATVLMMLMTLMGCGKSTGGTDSAPIASRPDVTVKYDGKRRKCVVALPTEAQGSVITCDDIVSFVRDDLRVPSGSIYDLGTISDSDSHPAEIAKVRASLDGAGYRFIGGPHNGR
jgi:hypothetical protein